MSNDTSNAVDSKSQELKIKIAFERDLDLVRHYLNDLLMNDCPYTGFFKDYVFPDEVILDFLGNNANKSCVILLSGEEDVGFASFQKGPMDNTPFSVASLVTVYLRPEYRNKGNMGFILEILEGFAQYTGCQYTSVGSSSGADPSKFGYNKSEVIYIKEIK